jgi:hypothetical protein
MMFFVLFEVRSILAQCPNVSMFDQVRNLAWWSALSFVPTAQK